jgi:hypothetical protein
VKGSLSPQATYDICGSFCCCKTAARGGGLFLRRVKDCADTVTQQGAFVDRQILHGRPMTKDLSPSAVRRRSVRLKAASNNGGHQRRQFLVNLNARSRLAVASMCWSPIRFPYDDQICTSQEY